LTIDERNKLYDAEITNERLSRVRDLFVLQCLLGCRVGDFVRLAKNNISNNILQYIPEKTKTESQKVARIPLTSKAKKIIEKYNYPGGMLMPFISDQRYNEYIKDLFQLIELKRLVIRLNPITLQSETKELWQVASSHMARKTFIDILIKAGKSRDIIASMTGHTANSRAFSRYYTIDDNMRASTVEAME
jgi:integrase